MSPNLTWSVRAGYNFKKSWCSSTTTVLRPLLPVSHTSVFSYRHSALTGRINKFIRQSLWDSLLDLLVASVGKLFHPNNSLARTTVSFLCYVSGLKTSYRSLCDPTGPKAVLVLRSDRFVVALHPKRVPHCPQAVLCYRWRIATKYSPRSVFLNLEFRIGVCLFVPVDLFVHI